MGLAGTGVYLVTGRRKVLAACVVIFGALGCKDRAELDASSARARAAALEHLRTSAAATADGERATDDEGTRDPSPAPIEPPVATDDAPTMDQDAEARAEVVATRAAHAPVEEPRPVTRTETYIPDEKDGEFDRPPPDITLYQASWCGYCKRAKKWLEERKISYDEVDIEESDNAKKLSLALSKEGQSYSGIPVVAWNDTWVKGFRPDEYMRLATASGWAPKTATREVDAAGRPVRPGVRVRETRPVRSAPSVEPVDDGPSTPIYTYTDRNGVTHVVDHPNRIPKRYR